MLRLRWRTVVCSVCQVHFGVHGKRYQSQETCLACSTGSCEEEAGDFLCDGLSVEVAVDEDGKREGDNDGQDDGRPVGREHPRQEVFCCHVYYLSVL